MDYCTTKQISTFVLALIGFSVLVFFIEEYTEENEMQNTMEMKHAFYKNEHEMSSDQTQKSPKYSVEECWKYEPFKVVTQCAPCKDFEIRAIKAVHCLKTGYFDRVNCSKSSTTVLRPCAPPKNSRRRDFYIFSIINLLILAASLMAAVQRKKVLERAIYMRLPQYF